MRHVYSPAEPHKCNLAGTTFPDFIGFERDTPWKVGTIAQCEDCGQYWVVEPPMRVTQGQQSMNNRWTKISAREVRRILKRAKK